MPVICRMKKHAFQEMQAFESRCEVVPLPRRLDQRFLFYPRQCLDDRFAFQCQTSTRDNFVVDETDGKTTASVSRSCPGVVLVTPTAHVAVDTRPGAGEDLLRVEQQLRFKNWPHDPKNGVLSVKLGNLQTPYGGATVALARTCRLEDTDQTPRLTTNPSRFPPSLHLLDP